MEATRVTSSEFQTAFGTLSDKARHAPVVITKHGKNALVVISAAERGRLRRRERHVGLTTDLDDDWIAAVRDAEVPDQFAHLDADLT